MITTSKINTKRSVRDNFRLVYFHRRRNHRLHHQPFHLSLCTARSPASVLEANSPRHSVTTVSFAPSKLWVSLHLNHMIHAHQNMSIPLHRIFQRHHLCIFRASHPELSRLSVRCLLECACHPLLKKQSPRSHHHPQRSCATLSHRIGCWGQRMIKRLAGVQHLY